jgi:acyl carrier protein
MNRQEIETALLHFLRTAILAEDVVIVPHEELRGYGIDSFSIVEIILFIERKFGIVLPDDQLKPEHFRSVEAIAALVVNEMK